MKKRYFNGISINVILLGIISFLNDMSSEMITPILPMFISSLGGTGLVIGLVGGIRDSISSLLKVFSGYLSDKTGKRKVFIFSGYLTSSIFKIVLALAQTWQQILIFIGLERIGKGIRTAAIESIIADSMPKQRGRGFGIHRAFDTTGAVIGSCIVFFLFWYLNFNFRSIILIAALFAFVSLVPLHFIKEKKSKPQNITLKLSLKNLPKSLKLFIFIASIFALANFSYMFFILKTLNLFEGKYAIGITLLLYILFNLFYAVFAVPVGNLSDKIGRKNILIAGFLLFSITTLGFALFNSLSIFVSLFILYGITYALIEGTQRAFVSDLSPEHLRATALGTFHTIIGLIALPSSLIAGLLWQFNPISTFIYGSSLSLLSAVLFLNYKHRFRNA